MPQNIERIRLRRRNSAHVLLVANLCILLGSKWLWLVRRYHINWPVDPDWVLGTHLLIYFTVLHLLS